MLLVVDHHFQYRSSAALPAALPHQKSRPPHSTTWHCPCSSASAAAVAAATFAAAALAAAALRRAACFSAALRRAACFSASLRFSCCVAPLSYQRYNSPKLHGLTVACERIFTEGGGV